MGFFTTILGQIILRLLETLAVLVPLLILVAYATYAERKALAAIQACTMPIPASSRRLSSRWKPTIAGCRAFPVPRSWPPARSR